MGNCIDTLSNVDQTNFASSSKFPRVR